MQAYYIYFKKKEKTGRKKIENWKIEGTITL
jgi:hypothetical protein